MVGYGEAEGEVEAYVAPGGISYYSVAGAEGSAWSHASVNMNLY
jgi:hypothetical protein